MLRYDDLPTEIRLEVYQHLFDAPNRFFELRPSGVLAFRSKNSYPLLIAQMGGLRMMRVCRKIRGEVAEYFYGGNNFRFSQDHGFAVMSCFLSTSGSFNCSFLRHITVQLSSRLAYGYDRAKSNYVWDGLRSALSRKGMWNPNYVFQRSYEEEGHMWADMAFSQLREMLDLKRLEITIPTCRWPLRVDPTAPTRRCACYGVDLMGRDDRVRHIARNHSGDSEYGTCWLTSRRTPPRKI